MYGTEKMKNKIFRRFFGDFSPTIKMERLSVFEVVLFFYFL